MKQKRLYLMCGIPGSGKSTVAENYIKNNDNVIWVSRDKIRFSLLKEGEDYFSHENEVLDLFYSSIQQYLDNGYDVIADATHLNSNGRHNTLAMLNLKDVELNVIYLNVPLKVAMERNDKRTGLSRVPQSVVRRMYYQQEAPTYAEGWEHIYVVNEWGGVRELEP